MPKKDEIQNPHDVFFKSVWSDLEVAKSFVENYLPAEVVQILDLSSLELNGESFVDEKLQSHHTDLLYRLKLKTGETALVYILLEHKSYLDKFVAFQLARYILKIWEQFGLEKSKKLPLIFPIVLYHGKNRWNYKKELVDLVEKSNSPMWRKHILNFEYFLCDISAHPADEIKGIAMLQAAFSLMKYIHKPDELLPRLVGIFELFILMPRQTVVEFLSKVLKYLAVSGKIIARTEVDNAMDTAFKQKKKQVDWYHEFVEQWRAEGRDKGRIEGKVEGKVLGKLEGLQQGEKNLLLRQITKRFGKVNETMSNQLDTLPVAKLEILGENLFDFSTMDDVENWLKANADLSVSE